MQHIAGENNLAETALFRENRVRPLRSALVHAQSRSRSVRPCHAGQRLGDLQFLDTALNEVRFQTRSGELVVTRGQDGRNVMSLPSNIVAAFHPPGQCRRAIGEALGVAAPQHLVSRHAMLMAALGRCAKIIRSIKGVGEVARVLHALDIWGLIATATARATADLRFRLPLLRACQGRAGRPGDRLGALRAHAFLGQAPGKGHAQGAASLARAAAIFCARMMASAPSWQGPARFT